MDLNGAEWIWVNLDGSGWIWVDLGGSERIEGCRRQTECMKIRWITHKITKTHNCSVKIILSVFFGPELKRPAAG